MFLSFPYLSIEIRGQLLSLAKESESGNPTTSNLIPSERLYKPSSMSFQTYLFHLPYFPIAIDGTRNLFSAQSKPGGPITGSAGPVMITCGRTVRTVVGRLLPVSPSSDKASCCFDNCCRWDFKIAPPLSTHTLVPSTPLPQWLYFFLYFFSRLVEQWISRER